MGLRVMHDDSTQTSDGLIAVGQAHKGKHSFRVVHRPLFFKNQKKKEDVSREVVKGVGDDSLLDGELCLKMAGVEYPLHQRAIKEL